MPIVPIEENKVGLATTTDAKFRAPDYSGSGLEALGAGLVHLGAGLEERRRRAAEAIAAAMLDDRHQGNIDDAAVKKAYVDYSDGSHEALHGDDGLLKQRGATAHAAFPGLVETLVDNHDKSLSKLDDVQRAVVAPAMNERLRSDVARAAIFVRREARAEQKWQSEQLQKTAARDAMNHADDPGLFDHHLATGEKAIRQQAKIDNLSDEMLNKQIADYRSGVHADVVDALAQRDPVAAAAWRDRFGGNLNARDNAFVEAALARGALAGHDRPDVAGTDFGGEEQPAETDVADEDDDADVLHESSFAPAATTDAASRNAGTSLWSGVAQPASADDSAALAAKGAAGSAEGVASDQPANTTNPVDRIAQELRRNKEKRSATKPASPYPATPAKTAPIATMPKSWPILGENGQPAGTPAVKGARDPKSNLPYADGRFDGTGALKYRLKVNKATGELMGHRHQGVDLPGRVETPVRVSADGVVVRNRPQGVPATAMKIGPDGKKHREPAFEPQRDVNGRIVYQEGKPVMVPTFKTAGYGNVVVVSHANGAYRTWYGHLEYQSNLKPGTQISRGSVLGLLGNTGNARGQGSHVHFGVQKRVGFDKNGQPIYIWIDPIDWMHGVQ